MSERISEEENPTLELLLRELSLLSVGHRAFLSYHPQFARHKRHHYVSKGLLLPSNSVQSFIRHLKNILPQLKTRTRQLLYVNNSAIVIRQAEIVGARIY